MKIQESSCIYLKRKQYCCSFQLSLSSGPMPRKATGHVKFMVMLPAALVKTIKRVAGEKHQTFSAVAEEWLLKGQAEYEASKVEK
jgi:hypothetical protein